MKKLLSMLLIGVLLMGIGGAACVFELSSFTYTTSPTGELFAPSTSNINVRTPNESGSIYFDAYGYQEATVAVDDSLSDQTLRIELYGPNQLFKYHVTPSDNTLHLYYEADPFKVISAVLDGMKHKEVISIEGNFDITIYASSATAQRLEIGPDPAREQNRSRMEEMRTQYETNIQEQRAHYDEQLSTLRESYEEQLTTQRENYEEQLQTQRENYEERLETQKANYEEQLKALQNSHE